jgi:hypothetical protein
MKAFACITSKEEYHTQEIEAMMKKKKIERRKKSKMKMKRTIHCLR